MHTPAKHRLILRLTLAAACLGLALSLPFLTGQLRELGNRLCPMHLPVLLCGLLLGARYGAAVGAVAPLLRSLLFGAPVLFPHALTMVPELAVYGLVCGLLRPRRQAGAGGRLYLALLCAMACGRAVAGIVKYALYLGGLRPDYSLAVFLSADLLNTLPGIAVQLVLVPLLWRALLRAGIADPLS